jgi:hypothetical protein
MDEKVLEKCVEAATTAMQTPEPANDIFSSAYK